jgi:hypothetical protein
MSCRQKGSYPETGLEEIIGDLPRANISLLIPLCLYGGVQCDSGPKELWPEWPEHDTALRVRAQEQV